MTVVIHICGHLTDGHLSALSPRSLPQAKPIRSVMGMELEVERLDDHPNDDTSSSSDSSSVSYSNVNVIVTAMLMLIVTAMLML